MEMERLSLGKAAKSDRTAAARLATLDSELSNLKSQQVQITSQWDGARKEMMKVKVRVGSKWCWGLWSQGKCEKTARRYLSSIFRV